MLDDEICTFGMHHALFVIRSKSNHQQIESVDLVEKAGIATYCALDVHAANLLTFVSSHSL